MTLLTQTEMDTRPTTEPTEASPLKYWVDIVKYRALYLWIAVAMMVPGLVFMGLNMAQSPTHAPLKLGIDFVGGTLSEIHTSKTLQQEDLPLLAHALDAFEIEDAVVQINTPIKVNQQVSGTVLSIRTPMLTAAQIKTLDATLKNNLGDVQLLQRNTVGPTLATELLSNALLALGLAYLLITGYLTYRFQLDYAICALVALVHDTVIVLGIFAGLGYLANVAVDSLFITGILTVIGFSVHDTIVVFDRLRENNRLMFSQKKPFSEVVNVSINQTLARSINTSLTALLPLATLYFFGGQSTQNLVLCMGLGIMIGAYSSIAIASSLLCWWREKAEKGSVRV
jgi:preprotein translocase subunit SecF